MSDGNPPNPDQSGPKAAGPGADSRVRESRTPAWLRPVLAGAVLVTVCGGVGFGAGLLSRPDPAAPPLTRELAFDRTERQVKREMAARGYADGRRTGANHGIIAGGMASESDAKVAIQELRAGEAGAEAAAAQSELSGMTAAPALPSSGQSGGE